MNMQDIYKEAMTVNSTLDKDKLQEATKAFFEKLNFATLPPSFNWVDEIFEGLHVKERGDQPALIWADMDTDIEKKFSYRELAVKGNKCLNFLRNNGIKQGDNVYIINPIIPETWFSTLACLKGGIIHVPTATSVTVRELKFRFENVLPHCVIAHEAVADIVDEALFLSELNKKGVLKIVIGGDREGWLNYNEIEKEDEVAKPAIINKGDTLVCFFTSGTTGLAKMVGHNAYSYPLGHLSTAAFIGIRPGYIHHNLSAPGWAKWAWSSFFAPLSLGATVAAFNFSKLIPKKYLEYICKYKVNTFCAPPTAWRSFVREDLSQFDFSNLRYPVAAGEPLNPEVIQRFKACTNTTIRDFYGQTETVAMIGNYPWMEDRVKLGSFGRPGYMHDITLLTDDIKEISQPDQIGLIAVRLDRWRPIGMFDGYLKDPEKNKEVFIDKYYLTGDRAYFDRDGYWWFVSRADDVIKSSDYRVGPFEVESALVEHPAVLEAAVVGKPDPDRYQLVKAYVILVKGYEPSRELALELFKHTMKILPKYKIPRIIEFVSDVPKTISGKIRRVELRAREENLKKDGKQKGEHEYFYNDFPELKSDK